MKLRAIIVDDERLARVAMAKLLRKHPDVDIVGEARGVRDAARLVQDFDPNVIFLDVEMPGGSGFTLFDLVDVTASVVFVTGFDEYAVRAFKVNALDYLVKPVTPEDIARSLQRIRDQIPAAQSTGSLKGDDIVCLAEAHTMKFARVSEIAHIAAADDYSEVHLNSGYKALVSTRLKQWEERLPKDNFVRTHHSMLINLQYIDEVVFDKGRWEVRMRHAKHVLPMSRRFAHSLRARLRVVD